MSIFKRGEPLGPPEGKRYRIRITTEDGQVFYWHKRGQLHIVDEDVASVFVSHFNPQLFQVRPDGSLTPPAPGETFPIQSVTKEPV
jgi:hypothetical protein